MGAQICTLHDISAASDVASAHSLMPLRVLAAQNYCTFSSHLHSGRHRSGVSLWNFAKRDVMAHVAQLMLPMLARKS